MESYYDERDEARMEAKGIVRRLPYEAEGEIAHHDFVANRSLIPKVLEDFKPYADRLGVQIFYRLLHFLNGPQSVLETTDSLFRGPSPNTTPQHGHGAPLQVMGRFMVIFRDHKENLSEEAMVGLLMAFRDELSRIRPGWEMGCIGTAFYWAWFSSLSPVGSEEVTGKELVLLFWAWGNDEAECFDNFGTLMQGVGVALCGAQRRYQHWVSLGRPSLRVDDGLPPGWRPRVAEWAATKDRIRELHLFGSRAKGAFKDDSDVDIACLLTGDESGERLAYSICECGGWEEELSERLGVPVDLQFTDTADDLKVWAWVREHGQLIYRKPGNLPVE